MFYYNIQHPAKLDILISICSEGTVCEEHFTVLASYVFIRSSMLFFSMHFMVSGRIQYLEFNIYLQVFV